MSVFSKSSQKSNPDRKIILLERKNYNQVIVLIDNPENIVHNVLHKLFPNAEFSFLTNRSEKVDISTGNNFTVHKKDFKFAKLKNDRLVDLLSQRFDLLIDLSNENNNLKYFTDRIQSNLKVGCFDTTKNYHYDLLVAKSDNIKEILHQIEKQIDLLTVKQ